MALHTATCATQIGRDAEMAALASCADRRVTTLISGEAGVGKTRLAAEAAHLAASLGMGQLSGGCEPGGAVPYAAFATAMRRRTRTMDDASMAAVFEGPARPAAHLLPETSRVLGPHGEPPKQADLFAAVWQALHRLAGSGGSLLLLEDLHWADPESLQLFAYLAVETDGLDVWIVATYRHDELHRRHPLAGTLASLSRGRRFEEIRLQPLGRDTVALMVSTIFDGASISDEFVDAIDERTEGNPFFVEELLKVLLERGDVYLEDGAWERREITEMELPDTVRETLLSRARTLEPEGLDCLELAAIAGDRLDLAVLRAATGLGERELDEVLAEGLRLQLLVEQRDGASVGYRFRHALTREALAEELTGPDRRRAHLRVADAILEVHADDVDRNASALASHFWEAGDEPRCVDFSVRAARVAFAAGAADEAGIQFDRALRLRQGDPGGRLALLVEACEALVSGRDRRLPAAYAKEAVELARTLGDRDAESRALSTLMADAWDAGDGAKAIAYGRESLEAVRATGTDVEIRALSRYSRILALADRYEEADALVDGAIALATARDDDVELGRLFGTRMLLARNPLDLAASYRHAVDAATRARADEVLASLHGNYGYISLWTGHIGQSERALRTAIPLYAQTRPTDRYTHAGLAWVLSLQGELDEALEIAEPLRGNPHVPTAIVALTALCEIYDRRRPQPDAELTEVVGRLHELAMAAGEEQRATPSRAATARLCLRTEGTSSAIPRFYDALGTQHDALARSSHWMMSPDLARALWAEDHLDELSAWADAVHAVTLVDPNAHNLAADALVEGYRRSAQGKSDEARVSIEDALARYAEMPCAAREAEAALALAALEWRAGNAEATGVHARHAVQLATRLVAPALLTEARRLVERAESPVVVATVLFTDVVGSTERASALGDAAWRAQLERHNDLIRRELDRSGGREVKTTGDGFLVRFDLPAEAIRCAMHIRDGLTSHGLAVRAGIHSGQCHEVDGDLVGIAVHVAARICSEAGSGQILVSSTVRELVSGTGIAFDDQGTRALRGVDDEWHLFEVREVG